MVLEDGVKKLGAGTSEGFTAHLIGEARKRMAEEGYGGLIWISTIFDKRQKRLTMAWFGFPGAEGFAVQYDKIRRGRLDALCKTLSDLGNQILKMPDQGVKLWPPTAGKEFKIDTFSFPRACNSCRIFRFAPLRQLCLHGQCH